MSFLCEVDIGNRRVPSKWSEALTLLKDDYANSMIIKAFAEVMNQDIVIVTVHGVSFKSVVA